jgi:hypothetical protein
VRVADPDDPGGPAIASAAATVSDAALTATGSPAFASLNPVSGTLAAFTDANPGATVSDFTTGGGSTTISWGDGTTGSCTTLITSPCTVTKTSTGHFAVNGTHTYAVLGPQTITVSIVDDGGSTAIATTRVVVFAFAQDGSFVIGDHNSAIGTMVTFWGAQWAKVNSLSGGPAPSSFKGFEGSVTSPACGTRWTARPGNSAHPPHGPLPSFMGVIVASSITKHGSKISGNTLHIVVVTTNPGYKPNPGHTGTGTVVALVC